MHTLSGGELTKGLGKVMERGIVNKEEESKMRDLWLVEMGGIVRKRG